MTRTAIESFACLAAIAVAAFVLPACGDASAFKLRPDAWGETQPLVDWKGVFVELHHETNPCDAVPPECLRSFVGEHTEFEGLEVGSLKSGCAPGSEAAVEIDVRPRSIIFDFSNVENPGAFARADFNGFVINEVLQAAPAIRAVRVDRELSTLDLRDEDILVEGRKIRANFTGLSFEDTDFVKIDLLFED